MGEEKLLCFTYFLLFQFEFTDVGGGNGSSKFKLVSGIREGNKLISV